MLTLLHGDDIVSSRKVLEEIKLGHTEGEALVLDGRRVSLSDLKQALESLPMLGSSRLVILEHFFSSRPSKEMFSYLASGEFSSDLIIWEGKQISKEAIKKFRSRIKVRLFKTPAIVFQFLDQISPKNKKGSLLTLQKTLKSSPQGLVFYLLVQHIRKLLLIKSGQVPQGIQAWKLRKFQSQAKLFTLNSLRKLYQKLLLVDIAQKRGEERFDLAGELEMLVLGID